MFIFEFDEEGRILTHTIENVEEGGNWDKMTRVISVTDWLLGKAWGANVETYVTDPRAEPDPQKWQTELAILVAGGAAVSS